MVQSHPPMKPQRKGGQQERSRPAPHLSFEKPRLSSTTMSGRLIMDGPALRASSCVMCAGDVQGTMPAAHQQALAARRRLHQLHARTP